MIIIKESRKLNYEQIYINSIFEDILEENVPNNKNEILKSIENLDFDYNKEEFLYSLKTAIKRPYGVVLSEYTYKDLQKMKTFKVKGISAGFALKPHFGSYDIVSVHNASGIKQLGSLLIDVAIKLGGKYLDCFEGYLPSFYAQKGFVEYNFSAYDPKYDPEGKIKHALGGEKGVVYMKLKNAPTPPIDN